MRKKSPGWTNKLPGIEVVADDVTEKKPEEKAVGTPEQEDGSHPLRA